ncbi:MAG: carbonate dehydratase [Opitutae bacterium]|nr:carbonate dehydratase [Opitutae bacterium]
MPNASNPVGRKLARHRAATPALLFANNRAWSRQRHAQDPEFFRKLARQQNPAYLWIGCADSRVPANEIVGLLPGELFVHRNVANVVVHTDLNCLSVLQFAVDLLRVRHIIVCGHYGCSGIRTALRGERVGLADNWLRHVQDVRTKHEPLLAALPATGPGRYDRLCELNVIEQVVNVGLTTIVQDAWARGQQLSVHGWIYGLSDGLLHDLRASASAPEELLANYQQALQALERPEKPAARRSA